MSIATRIAPLQPAHRSRIESIVRATGVFSDAEVDVAMELFDSTDEDYEFFGAFQGEDDTLVGYACFGVTPATDRTYDLYWIVVHPDAQRSGAGSALMNAVEHTLQERRARMVVVETSSREEYAATMKFYDGRGYREAARVRDFYAVGDDRVVLTRRLAVPQPHPA